MKKIFADTYSIKEIGIHNYIKDYYWPINEDFYRDFISFMHETYVNLLLKKKNDSALFDILMTEYSFLVVHLEGILHYNMLKKKSKDLNSDIISSKENAFLNPDWDLIENYYLNYKLPFGKIKIRLRNFIKNIYFNKNNNYLVNIYKIIFNNKYDSFSIGSHSNLKSDILEQEKLFCNFIDIPQFVELKNLISTNFSKNIKQDAVKTISNFFDILNSKYNHHFLDINFTQIKEIWLNRIEHAAIIYERILNLNKLPKKILITSIAKPLNKLIILGAQRKGIEVYGFHHGNDIGLKKYKIAHYSERSHSRIQIVPTNNIKQSFEENYKNTILSKENNNIFISSNTKSYKDINSKIKSKSPTKSIMLIGSPANINRYVHEYGQFFYFKILLEYNIINTLKNNNFNVLYKVHPDRKKEIDGLFNDFVDDYLIDPFEKCWNKADRLIFTDTASTTFGFSLATNKQITLLDHNKDNENKRVKDLINKRVSIVDVRVNQDQKFTFSNQDLLNSLKEVKDIDFKSLL